MKIPKLQLHRKVGRALNHPNVLAAFTTFETWAKIFNRALILFLIVGAFIIIRRDYNENAYIVKPFSVPKALEDKGFTGSAFVNSMFIELTKARKTLTYKSEEGLLRSLSATHFVSDAQRNIFKMDGDASMKGVARIGDFDLSTLTYYLKRLTGKSDSERIISGIVTIVMEKKGANDTAKYVLQMKKMPDDQIITVEDYSAEGLIRKATFELILIDFKSSSYNQDHIINYLVSRNEIQNAERLAVDTEAEYTNDSKKTTSSQWIGLYLAWSNLYLAQNDFVKAAEKVDILALKCPSDISWRCQQILVNNTVMLNQFYMIGYDQNKVDSMATRTLALCDAIDSSKVTSDYVENKKSALAFVAFFASQALSVSSKTAQNRASVKEKLENALSLDKNLAIANNDLAYYYMLDARPIDMKKAELCLQKALKAFPNHCVFLDTYAEFYLYQKNYDKCFEYMEKALSNPNIFEHVSVADYKKDNRWEVFKDNKDLQIRFNKLLKKFEHS